MEKAVVDAVHAMHAAPAAATAGMAHESAIRRKENGYIHSGYQFLVNLVFLVYSGKRV